MWGNKTHLYDLYGVETSEAKVQATMADAGTTERVKEAALAGFELTEEADSNFYRIPADFLIDPDGIIREAFYSELVGQHMNLDIVDSYLNTPVMVL
jgi:thioredoxin-dependent peroxiredoxin